MTVYIGEELESFCISTHTPLAGRDAKTKKVVVGHGNFYSHAPRGT